MQSGLRQVFGRQENQEKLHPPTLSSFPLFPSVQVLLTLVLAAIVVPALSAEPKVDFAREIRPLLAKKCFACHGPDEEHREGGLRLDMQEGATKKLETGA